MEPILRAIVCLWGILIGIASCAPLGTNFKNIPSDEALTFMKTYGYIVDDGGDSEALYSEEGITEIIKTMQRFGGVEQTGKFDNATLKLLTTPRCGVPDIPKNKRLKRFTQGSEGWNKRELTFFVANWSPRLNEYIVVKHIQKALDTWGVYGRLKFRRSATPDADIVVTFARGYHGDYAPFDGPGNVLAHAFFPYEGSTMGGDIHFDDDEKWTDGNITEYGQTDFFTVALHELGHSLGLGHSDVVSAVMFPYYKSEPGSGSLLDYDDILGMYKLYISRRLEEDDNNVYTEEDDVETNTPHSTPSETSSQRPYTTTTQITTTTTYETTTRNSDKLPPRTHGYPTPPFGRPGWHFPHHHTTQRSTDERTVYYEGDDETVDDHKEHDRRTTIARNNYPSFPNICDGHFDAVATIRNELFIFKDQYIWRLRDKGIIQPGYPGPISQMFPGLPNSIKKVDAVYERPDGTIALFTGRQVWIYNGAEFVNSPLPLTYFGLPEYLDSIDAVQTWAKNKKTYFYKEDRFWRYNETAKAMDAGYPLHMDRWRGVPQRLDAATTWKDGTTYFFKHELFWKFDNDWVMVTEESPLPTAQIWLGCKEDVQKMKRLFGEYK